MSLPYLLQSSCKSRIVGWGLPEPGSCFIHPSRPKRSRSASFDVKKLILYLTQTSCEFGAMQYKRQRRVRRLLTSLVNLVNSSMTQRVNSETVLEGGMPLSGVLWLRSDPRTSGGFLDFEGKLGKNTKKYRGQELSQAGGGRNRQAGGQQGHFLFKSGGRTGLDCKFSRITNRDESSFKEREKASKPGETHSNRRAKESRDAARVKCGGVVGCVQVAGKSVQKVWIEAYRTPETQTTGSVAFFEDCPFPEAGGAVLRGPLTVTFTENRYHFKVSYTDNSQGHYTTTADGTTCNVIRIHRPAKRTPHAKMAATHMHTRGIHLRPSDTAASKGGWGGWGGGGGGAATAFRQAAKIQMDRGGSVVLTKYDERYSVAAKHPAAHPLEGR
ncbi:hypothetical protein R3P38DRAFT_2764746 [Favolaschia claudopus]|uniref:Uncharacterized protein n=1 Tax=Favolaschia claudopus TaxID=2862362 RepID=A0AAW0D968_9AGAR